MKLTTMHTKKLTDKICRLGRWKH